MLLFTVIVLVVALIYFLFLIYWAIIASTKTPSQLTSSNGLWFAVGLDQIPDAIAIGVVMGCILTIPQYSIFHALHLINTMLAIIIPCCVSPFGFFLGRVYAQTSVPNELLEHSGRFSAFQREDFSTRWKVLGSTGVFGSPDSSTDWRNQDAGEPCR